MPEHHGTPGPEDHGVVGGEPPMPALHYPPLRASTALNGIPKPLPTSSSWGPDQRSLSMAGGVKPRRTSHVPQQEHSGKGGKSREQAAAPQNLAAAACSSGNGITLAMAFWQHQHHRRLNGNTRCYFKGLKKKKKKCSGQ